MTVDDKNAIAENRKLISLRGRRRVLNGPSDIFIGPKRVALTIAAYFLAEGEQSYD